MNDLELKYVKLSIFPTTEWVNPTQV